VSANPFLLATLTPIIDNLLRQSSKRKVVGGVPSLKFCILIYKKLNIDMGTYCSLERARISASVSVLNLLFGMINHIYCLPEIISL
jgi:hypothetical protein